MSHNFTLLLLALTISSGIIYLIDKIFFQSIRLAPYKKELAKLSKKEKREFYKNYSLKAPLIADYSRSLFSVFLTVFIVRSFLLGNFLIPTASMTPTLPVGDFIFVNKTTYGIRNPFTNKVIIPISEPKRGDIAVFHFPVNPNVDFVKRIIGLPGDVISYKNKQLIINGKAIKYSNCKKSNNHYNNSNGLINTDVVCTEHLNGINHTIDWMDSEKPENFENLIVPKNSYFVMGDNRDNSEDSRYWGFVPKKDLVGKAELVWFSWNSLDNSVRWNEIGKTF